MKTLPEIESLRITDLKVAMGDLILYLARSEHRDWDCTLWLASPWRIEIPTGLVASYSQALTLMNSDQDKQRRYVSKLKPIIGKTIRKTVISNHVPDLTVCLSNDMRILTFQAEKDSGSWEVRWRDGGRIGPRSGKRVVKWQA